jgi:hypothetical protein
MLRSVDFNRTIGMWLASAKHAGDGTENRCAAGRLHHLTADLELAEIAVK